MIVNLNQLLEKAEAGNYAVIAPDFITLSEARVMVGLAAELKAPLILSYGPVLRPLMDLSNFDDFIACVLKEIGRVDVPICLHLDHATKLEEISEAIEAGFSSVMMDASTESWEVNVERTRQTVEMASGTGVRVEAELGHVAAWGDNSLEGDTHEVLTDPTQAAEFVRITGIDALAVAIGNRHGLSKGEPKIDFERLRELNASVDVPLVLHGASGIGGEQLVKTIHYGIRKINLFTEMMQAAHRGMFEALQVSVSDPFAVAAAQEAGIREVLGNFIQLSGSGGRS